MPIVSFSGRIAADGACRAGRRVVDFKANPKPSALLKSLRKHSGDVSEGSGGECFATRWILGRLCRFYRDGRHFVKGLNEDESFNSELLRFAHASLLIQQPVGDKRVLWVDATKDPAEVWFYGKPSDEYLKQARVAIDSPGCFEFVVDAYDSERHNFLRSVNHVRNE